MSDTATITLEQKAGKYLTFQLAGEEYGLEILKVKEIIGIMNITALPRTPDFVKGVINLRGKVIPVIDLRLKFGFEEAGHTDKTCIVVVEIGGTMVWMVVDAVTEVLRVADASIEPPSPVVTTVDSAFITGSAKVEERLIILLDLERVLLPEERGTTQVVTEWAAAVAVKDLLATLIFPSWAQFSEDEVL